MPNIADDFISIRARADQISGRAYEPGYVFKAIHKDPPQWATAGVLIGSFPAVNATKRPPDEVIEDFAKMMYQKIGQHTAYPNRSRPPFELADIKVKRCYWQTARDLFYANLLAETP